eukprot:364368-Chlamydomonas_euryale.AAC.5
MAALHMASAGLLLSPVDIWGPQGHPRDEWKPEWNGLIVLLCAVLLGKGLVAIQHATVDARLDDLQRRPKVGQADRPDGGGLRIVWNACTWKRYSELLA